MLELRTDFITRPEQTATVNCQLIIRSELLALPHQELTQRIREEAEANPALELEMNPLPSEIPLRVVGGYAAGGPADRDARNDVIAQTPAEYTLRDELHRLAACSLQAQQLEIVDWLIEAIDERGYLSATALDAAFELGVSEQEVEDAIAALQQLAPPGVGARDLRECLLLQLSALENEPPHVRDILRVCSEALAPDGWARVAAALQLTDEQISEALEFIRSNLRPYPGEQFRPQWQHLLPDNPLATIPDAIISLCDDRLEVTLTTSRTINLRLAEAYRRLDENMRALGLRAGDEATTRARAQVRAARQLVWSLQQRERSLYNITTAIVSCQRDFILEGALALRPLTHKQIAEMTGLHESTVSRAVSGKTVMLPDGATVSYSVFFDDALPARTVMQRIIASEPPDAPFTDEQLQQLMAERGYPIARRTVNKYRHVLGIPSAMQRKSQRAVA
ncbi:MAG: RNA polymerase factor sigma-54 [Armatimonadetes bacterium]|nr:RNA polymerase factor sigma-54 [Armatimonadota bacterium]